MTTVYTTLFDSNFLIRGAACLRSLARTAGRPVHVLVLALDDLCAQQLMAVVGPLPATVTVECLPLRTLEARFPALERARANRSLVEYYFTLTPFLCREAITRLVPGAHAVYIDADVYFFSDPEVVLAHCRDHPVVVTEHRFPSRLAHLGDLYGRFNVGWLAFDHSPAAEACLESWADQCLESCADRPEQGRFADQKYLDQWPERVPGLLVLDHRGVNAAPWNITGCQVRRGEPVPSVDSSPLIAYHFHRLRRLAAGRYEADFDGFGRLSPDVIHDVYQLYVAELCDLEARHRDCLPATVRSALVRFPTAGGGPVRRLWRAMRRLARTACRERVLFSNGVALTPLEGVIYG